MKKRALTKKRAQDCIAKMKEFGTYRDQKIGRVRADFPGLGPPYNKGDFVIVTRQNREEYVVEIPLALKDIDPEKRGYITTIGTMMSVPKHLIEEVPNRSSQS